MSFAFLASVSVNQLLSKSSDSSSFDCARSLSCHVDGWSHLPAHGSAVSVRRDAACLNRIHLILSTAGVISSTVQRIDPQRLISSTPTLSSSPCSDGGACDFHPAYLRLGHFRANRQPEDLTTDNGSERVLFPTQLPVFTFASRD